MRCRVGDLAVVIQSAFQENIGLLVEVMSASVLPYHDWLVSARGSPLTGRPVLGTSVGKEVRTGKTCNVRDDQLRPIRPQEGNDETLTWASLPQEIA